MATAPNNRLPRIMSVTEKSWITPHMIRVTCHAPWIKELPAGIEGAHFKIFMPKPAQPDAEFARQLQEGPRPDVRTYTIRYVRPEQGEIDIDFVDHGDAGPASAWARRCVAGDIAAFAGPGPVKLADYYGDTYVIAADMSALPVAAATLEAMPRDAVGVAYLAVTSRDDQQAINAPAGVDVQWIVHPDPHEPAQQAVAKIKELPELTGVVQTCIAGESTMIKELRAEIINRRGVPKNDAYISGYWKIGLIEDEHQQVKRAEGD
ncbi:NADPH-dependent ferric siderophore reductase, contains FAD-binding and SIP domains [Yoonia tamlensis]|uniref:NADPH-dependent ferric siderophore reductase, contains FAD-binding and SIP domains n=1 Tax=Yoonia tamlensis TaxID=390270 RepID=A0A1I6GZP8_9RHOB|nr:siderophore-interacting protein [Yoonia tamlensis]SFR47683.1 NADPH-dependent ferric siderophore reductase, contains FAD-binding and SIP domains [Yoonia tamlensis]